MLKIAICDDEIRTCNILENQLCKIFNKYAIDSNIDLYYKSSHLQKNMIDGRNYDLILFDLNGDRFDGIAFGKWLRNYKKDELTKLVYLSGKESYAMDWYSIRPFDCMTKPVSENQMEQTILLGIRLLKMEDPFFVYKQNKTIKKEFYKDILYFESDKRKIIIHKQNETIAFYGKMEQVAKQLDIHKFWEIHKSYIVNCAWIKEFAYDRLSLKNSEIIPISQSKRSLIRKKRFQFREI